MRWCTPGGKTDLPALPHIELDELNRVVLAQYPHYKNGLHVHVHNFEGVWKKRIDSIELVCKRARRKANPWHNLHLIYFNDS